MRSPAMGIAGDRIAALGLGRRLLPCFRGTVAAGAAMRSLGVPAFDLWDTILQRPGAPHVFHIRQPIDEPSGQDRNEPINETL